MKHLPALRHPAVRDLAWAIFSPALVTRFSFHPSGSGIENFQPILSGQRSSWLTALDRNPDPLLQSLSDLKSTRLGIYFEALWRYFIATDPQLELLAANVPVSESGKTLGEFDLIIFDRTRGEHLHIELATKYYLRVEGYSGNAAEALSDWLGPNSRDRLNLKVDRLLTHQVTLSGRPQARKLLRDLNVHKLTRAVALKGCLFYPQVNAGALSIPPDELNPHHPRGHWLRHNDLHTIIDSADYWHVLERPRWLSPALLADENLTGLLDRPALEKFILDYFSQPHARPQMLCAMQKCREGMVECARYMVTQTAWPELPGPDNR